MHTVYGVALFCSKLNMVPGHMAVLLPNQQQMQKYLIFKTYKVQSQNTVHQITNKKIKFTAMMHGIHTISPITIFHNVCVCECVCGVCVSDKERDREGGREREKERERWGNGEERERQTDRDRQRYGETGTERCEERQKEKGGGGNTMMGNEEQNLSQKTYSHEYT